MPQDPSKDKPIGQYDPGRAERELAKPVFQPSLSSRVMDAGRSVASNVSAAGRSFADTFRRTPPFASRSTTTPDRAPVTRSARSRR